MKDSFDVTIDVKSLVTAPAIATILGSTGKIFQTERPSGREAMIDLVINCLGITNTSIQKGSGNINGYVPAIISEGVKMADQAKLMTLSRTVISLVDAQYKNSFQTWIEDTPTIMQDTDGSYFVNIPFEYQSIQDNFKNI